MPKFDNLGDQKAVFRNQDLTRMETFVLVALLAFRNSVTGQMNPPVYSTRTVSGTGPDGEKCEYLTESLAFYCKTTRKVVSETLDSLVRKGILTETGASRNRPSQYTYTGPDVERSRELFLRRDTPGRTDDGPVSGSVEPPVQCVASTQCTECTVKPVHSECVATTQSVCSQYTRTDKEQISNRGDTPASGPSTLEESLAPVSAPTSESVPKASKAKPDWEPLPAAHNYAELTSVPEAEIMQNVIHDPRAKGRRASGPTRWRKKNFRIEVLRPCFIPDDSKWQRFLDLRYEYREGVSMTLEAMEILVQEAHAVGWSPASVVAYAAGNGWHGFLRRYVKTGTFKGKPVYEVDPYPGIYPKVSPQQFKAGDWPEAVEPADADQAPDSAPAPEFELTPEAMERIEASLAIQNGTDADKGEVA